MPLYRLLPLLLAVALPGAARGAIEPDDLPGGAEWYLHVDLAALRDSDSGRALHRWLDAEVFAEVRREVGIDLGTEVDRITAFADTGLGTVLVVDGPISSETRDKLLALAAAEAKLDTLKYDGATYYHLYDRARDPGARRSLEGLEDSAWFTFAVPDKIIVASEQKQLEALIEAGGRIPGSGSHAGSLFVLTADKEFVQAGARTADFTDDESDWDSNILRNTESIAFLVSDAKGLLALEARLVSRDPAITQSLGSIINGLIGLQALNTELDPEIVGIIRNTKVQALENVLLISTVFDPGTFVSLLDENKPARAGSD